MRLVFIAMPSGKKRDPRQAYEIDFDRIYEVGIKPAFEKFAVDLIRADEERSGGLIHFQMFERLLLADIAVVDVTSENANVCYELGIRHAARPGSTIVLRSAESGASFDTTAMHAITYTLDNGILSDAAGAELALAIAARVQPALADQTITDSPLFERIPQYPGVTVPAGAAQTFFDREAYLERFRRRLLAARRQKDGLAEIIAIEDEIGAITDATSELVIDLALSYRDLATPAAYDRLITLVERIPPALRDRSIALRQQYALALNRRNVQTDRHRAIDLLETLCAQHGETAETCGMLGRISKDVYNDALLEGDTARARRHLLASIKYYRRGFTADPRDFYPGVNLIALLTMEGSDESLAERQRVLPAVAFAAARRDSTNENDYWTIATILELAVHGNDWKSAKNALARILALPRSTETPFQIQSTTGQLALVRRHEPQGVDLAELDAMLLELLLVLPPASAATLVSMLSQNTYAAYRGAQSTARLAEFDAQVAKMLVTLAPKSLTALFSMISDTEFRTYRAELAPEQLKTLKVQLDRVDFAKLVPGA